MKGLDPKTRRLLRQANLTAESNKRAAAQQLYRELLDEQPDLVPAIFGLAQVSDDEATQASLLTKALTLDPEYKPAQRALGILRGEIEPEPEPVAEDVADVDAGAPSGLERFDSAKADAPRDWSTDETAAARLSPVDEPATVFTTVNEPPTTSDPLVSFKSADEDHAHEAVDDGAGGGLRCYRCGKPITMQNSKLTPVGYLCNECVREAEDVFFTATPVHYAIATAVSAVVGLLAAFIMWNILGRVSFFAFFILIFASPVVGTSIGRIVLWSTGKRRGRYIPHVVGFMVVAPTVLLGLLAFFGGGILLAALIVGYGAFACSAAYYQLR